MHMMSRLTAVIGAVLCLGAAPAGAQSSQGILVELFTSQGCSSCPPADAVLESLTKSQGVIPLALHVDYWDYIGWRDTFAQEKFSNRQRKYAAANAEKMVYTPQMIVAGRARVRGNDAAELHAEIAAARSAVTLDITRSGADVVITAPALTAPSGEFLVDIVRYRPQSTVSIERGENQGRQIAYHNIVTQWENLGKWSGREPLVMRARAAGDAPVVIIIQRQGPRDVLAAAVLK